MANLNDVVAEASALWPTPAASDATGGKIPPHGTPLPAQVAQALWATPIANDAEKRGVPKVGAGLAGQVHRGPMPAGPADATAKPGGSLSSEFVGWLMGYPLEYLACAPETTAKRPG